MEIQNNYVLVSMDSESNTNIQSFTEYEAAYKTMETEYKQTLLASKMSEDDTDDDTYIEKTSAQIYNGYGDTICWIIKKTFVQTPEMAAICRQYDEMIAEGEKGSSFHKIKRSAEFSCPYAEANIYACYDNDKKILYFAVCYMPFAEQKEFIPYETYKWCVEQGLKKVTGIAEAIQILVCIDDNASFGNKY